jgi:hypothetical protein
MEREVFVCEGLDRVSGAENIREFSRSAQQAADAHVNGSVLLPINARPTFQPRWDERSRPVRPVIANAVLHARFAHA